MKKIILIVCLLALLCSGFTLPPALPSSFWGECSGIPVGAAITISYGGIEAKTATLTYAGKVYYAVNLVNGVEGDIVYFRYAGRVVGQAAYHVGTNQHIDLVYTPKVRPGVKHG